MGIPKKWTHKKTLRRCHTIRIGDRSVFITLLSHSLCIIVMCTQVSNDEMLSLVTSQTQFLDMSRSGGGDVDADSVNFESLKDSLRAPKDKVKVKFKEHEMFPLVRDMWFYSENQ